MASAIHSSCPILLLKSVLCWKKMWWKKESVIAWFLQYWITKVFKGKSWLSSVCRMTKSVKVTETKWNTKYKHNFLPDALIHCNVKTSKIRVFIKQEKTRKRSVNSRYCSQLETFFWYIVIFPQQSAGFCICRTL